MDKLKKFDEFITESIDYNKYQRLTKKILKSVGIDLYYYEKYYLSISSLYSIISNIIDIGDFNIENTIDNTIMVTLCSLSILVKESKEKTKKLFLYTVKKDIPEEYIHEIINYLKSLLFIFIEISKKFGKKITNFHEMISNTELFIPFNNTINHLLNQEKINMDMLNNIEEIDNEKLTHLIDRILHKLSFLINNKHKFQNKDNIKPLMVNYELKSPELKPKKYPI